MKKDTLNSPQLKMDAVDSLFAEMILDKALLDFRKKNVQQKIEQSLQDRNKKEFLRLTGELKSIQLL